jgi:16S rRNA (guanine527-N7)-methyltransferase
VSRIGKTARAHSRPSRERLQELLEKSGIHLTPPQLDQLWRYHRLLWERNRDRDLTRIVGFDATVIKHYVDCMIVGDHADLPCPLVDIGTGAGFPGIPLKIRYPHLTLTLAEPRPRRAAFLRDACQMLRFQNVDVFDHKVTSQSFQKPMAAAISRALELALARKRVTKSFRVVADQHYVLPHTKHKRRLIVVEII